MRPLIVEGVCGVVVGLAFGVVGYFVVQDTYEGLMLSGTEFGARVTVLRQEAHVTTDPGKSLEEMAKNTGLPAQDIQAVELGRKVANDSFRRVLLQKYPGHSDLLLAKRSPVKSVQFYVWIILGVVLGLVAPRLLQQRHVETDALNACIDTILRQKLELTLRDILGDNIYNNVKSSHIALLTGYGGEAVNEIMGSGKAGIRFFSRKTPGEYAKLSQSLDEATHLQQACNLFTPDMLFGDRDVQAHLALVNKRAASGEVEVTRLQIVTRDSVSKFRAPSNLAHMTHYNNTYRNVKGVEFCWAFDTDIAGSYILQDYLLYDSRLVLVYDIGSMLLELDVGGIIDEYAEVFSSTTVRGDADFEEFLKGNLKHPKEQPDVTGDATQGRKA